MASHDSPPPAPVTGRQQLEKIIFDADTRAGKIYDIALLIVISASVVVAMLDSVSGIQSTRGPVLSILEWILTGLFTLDYLVRIYCVTQRINYALSFFGIIDLMSVIPTYLSIVIPGSNYLATLRFLRVLRMFKVLKLSTYLNESLVLLQAVKASYRRIIVFLLFVLTIVVVLGSLMYTVEGEANGFTSIPRSIYWAIVTLTTVGYGDISPQTPFGQAIAALIMILGYSIIVVPTGLVASAVPRTGPGSPQTTSPADSAHTTCTNCGNTNHDNDARFCKMCGIDLIAQRHPNP